MAYTPSSFFNKKLKGIFVCNIRKLFSMVDVQLEIDDEGKPYYIRSFGEFISGRNGFDVKGIVVVEPLTGETKLSISRGS